jgi:hypothetical protein
MRSILVYTFLLLLLAGCTVPPSPGPQPPPASLGWNPACPDVSQVVITDSNGVAWHFCPDQIMDENGVILWQGEWVDANA